METKQKKKEKKNPTPLIQAVYILNFFLFLLSCIQSAPIPIFFPSNTSLLDYCHFLKWHNIFTKTQKCTQSHPILDF